MSSQEVPQLRVSPESWERAIASATRDGNARALLELLLHAGSTASDGTPLSVYELPPDLALRERVVRTLVFVVGRWPASTMSELWTKEGFGHGKPRTAELEVGFAELLIDCERRSPGSVPPDSFDAHAESLGIEPDQLKRRVRARRKNRK